MAKLATIKICLKKYIFTKRNFLAKKLKLWPKVKISDQLKYVHTSFTLFSATVGQNYPKIVGNIHKIQSKIPTMGRFYKKCHTEYFGVPKNHYFFYVRKLALKKHRVSYESSSGFCYFIWHLKRFLKKLFLELKMSRIFLFRALHRYLKGSTLKLYPNNGFNDNKNRSKDKSSP